MNNCSGSVKTRTSQFTSAHDVVLFAHLRELRHRGARSARAVADWLAWLETEGKATASLRSYSLTIDRYLLRLFPDKPIEEMSEGDWLQCLRALPPGSRRTGHAHFKSLGRYAVRAGLIPSNPFNDPDRLPVPKGPRRKIRPTFTDAEVNVLCALPSPDGELFDIGFSTGLRPGEMQVARLRYINYDDLTLAVFNSKGDKDRVLNVSLRLVGLVEQLALFEGLERDDFLWYDRPGGHHRRHQIPSGYENRTGLSEVSFHRWFHRCLDLAGVEADGGDSPRPRTAHCIRHTFSRRWRQRGGRLETLQTMLGHESIQTTVDYYGHLDRADVRADLDLVESTLRD